MWERGERGDAATRGRQSEDEKLTKQNVKREQRKLLKRVLRREILAHLSFIRENVSLRRR